jgi:hypothetical protein
MKSFRNWPSKQLMYYGYKVHPDPHVRMWNANSWAFADKGISYEQENQKAVTSMTVEYEEHELFKNKGTVSNV